MKKISRRAFLKVSGIGAAALGAAALTACGGTSSAAGSSAAGSTSAAAGSAAAQVSGDITFLTNRTDLDGDGTYESLIARFNEKYPDVTVEVESITDYAGELATRMQTAEYGDVLMIPDAVPKSAYAKYFVPFGTADELKDKYQEAYLYSKWYDGQVYGLAYMCTVQGIVYNKAVFEKAGITALPGTVDEFLTDLQAIKDKTDAIPYYTNTNSGWTLDQWEDHCYGSITGDADYKNNKLPHDKTAFDEGASHYTVARLLYDIVDKKLCEDDPTTCDWESSKGMLNNGEIGMLPSASLNSKGQGLYEPSHGSAPDIAGKGVANPLATILSAAMMLRFSLNQEEAAQRIEAAVQKVLAQGLRTPDIYSEGTTKVGTAQMGDAVVKALQA